MAGLLAAVEFSDGRLAGRAGLRGRLRASACAGVSVPGAVPIIALAGA